MLKLEKHAKNHDIIIGIRSRRWLADRLFWQALALALAIHIGAFFLFHIQPFKFDSSYIFPSFHMQAKSTGKSVSNEISEKEEILTTLLSPPEPDLLALMPMPYIGSEKFPSSLVMDSQPFDQLESLALPITHSIPTFYYHPLQLVISGPLAAIPLIKNSIPSQDVLAKSDRPLKAYQILFHVQVDGKRGQICWLEKKQESGNRQLDQLAETLLLEMQFAPFEDNPFMAGAIELTFLKKSKDD